MSAFRTKVVPVTRDDFVDFLLLFPGQARQRFDDQHWILAERQQLEQLVRYDGVGGAVEGQHPQNLLCPVLVVQTLPDALQHLCCNWKHRIRFLQQRR